jgi:Domain of unknown function (DUF6438)
MIRPVALGLLVAACGPRPVPPPADTIPAAAGPVVTLERTSCFGRCPVYRLSISAAGVVHYEGKAHVEHLGPAEDTIPSARVDSLVGELDRLGYFGLAEGYAPDSPACGRYVPDSPAVITSVTADGRQKRVRHDYGCSDAPPALTRIEARIDEVAGTSRWTGR